MQINLLANNSRLIFITKFSLYRGLSLIEFGRYDCYPICLYKLFAHRWYRIVDLVLFSEMLGYLKKVAKLESFKGDTSIHPLNPTEKGIEDYQTRTSATTSTTTYPTIASALWKPLWPPGWSYRLSFPKHQLIVYFRFNKKWFYRLASKRFTHNKIFKLKY